jgi:hypothetical protein
MEKIWFIFEKGRHLGPFSIQELKKKIASKEIQSNDLVWKEGMDKFVSVKAIAELELLKGQNIVLPNPHIITLNKIFSALFTIISP